MITTELLTAKQVAYATKSGHSTVRRWIASKELKVVRLGKSVRIRPADLEQFISERVSS